jgi:hypothetical protein
VSHTAPNLRDLFPQNPRANALLNHLLLGDVVDAFGKRFDKIERDMATRDQNIALQSQVNSIEQQLRET